MPGEIITAIWIPEINIKFDKITNLQICSLKVLSSNFKLSCIFHKLGKFYNMFQESF